MSNQKKSDYYVGKRELKDYVAKAEAPSSLIFLDLHKHLFYGHVFDSVEDLRAFWVQNFKNAARNISNSVSKVHSLYWKRLYNLKKVSVEMATAILFQYSNFVLTNNRNLDTFIQIVDPILTNHFDTQPHNDRPLYIQLQYMAWKLLKKSKRTIAETEALKLSLSRIADTIDPGITNVFKEYIESNIWAQLARDEEDDHLDDLLDPNDRSFITSFCSSLTLIGSTMGKDNLVQELLGLRKSLEKDKKKNVLEYQLVRIYLYVFDNMDYWYRHLTDTEDEHVFRVKMLLKIVFEDLVVDEIELKSGEKAARATKQTKFFNNFQFAGGINSTFHKNCLSPNTATPNTIRATATESTAKEIIAATHSSIVFLPSAAAATEDSDVASTPATATTATTNNSNTADDSINSNIVGKRIDISIYGSHDLELSLTEVKPGSEIPKLQKQESKCLRDNQCIYFNLKDLGVNSDIIMGSLWGGMEGKLIYIKYVDGCGIAKVRSKLTLPSHMLLLGDFYKTVLSFYEYKNYCKSLNDSARTLYATNNISLNSSEMPHTISTPRN